MLCYVQWQCHIIYFPLQYSSFIFIFPVFFLYIFKLNEVGVLCYAGNTNTIHASRLEEWEKTEFEKWTNICKLSWNDTLFVNKVLNFRNKRDWNFWMIQDVLFHWKVMRVSNWINYNYLENCLQQQQQ